MTLCFALNFLSIPSVILLVLYQLFHANLQERVKMLNLYIGQKQEWLNKNGCKDMIFYGQNKKYNLGDMIETTKKQLLVAAVN